MAQTLTETAGSLEAMTPVPYAVAAKRQDTYDTWTLELEPQNGAPIVPGPGQFNMLYAFGVGEVPISNAGHFETEERLVHTIRAVGAVTKALCAAEVGTVIGVRGPFGNTWPIEDAKGKDVVIVAGGIGLPPLRPAIYHVLKHREDYGRFVLLYGARTPSDLLFLDEVKSWQRDYDVDLDLTVDAGDTDWKGKVGLVTKLIPPAQFDADDARGFIVGPEIMMKFVAQELMNRDLPAKSIYVSMERTMRCGVGLCGHCQIGPTLVCRDGAVYTWDEVENLIAVKEL
jgi:NAD(P)H-flavin reductase